MTRVTLVHEHAYNLSAFYSYDEVSCEYKVTPVWSNMDINLQNHNDWKGYLEIALKSMQEDGNGNNVNKVWDDRDYRHWLNNSR